MMRKCVVVLLIINMIFISLAVFDAKKGEVNADEKLNSRSTQEQSDILISMDQEINVIDQGAKGDGIADDTTAIQNVLNENDTVYIPDGTYMINVDVSLKPKANQTILMSDNAILKAIPSSRGEQYVISIDGVSNVSITGGIIIGERNQHQGTEGEWGMGINIVNGASNIVIKNIAISDCWGDGIYLGGSPAVNAITIDEVTCDNNRRQGLSVTNAKNVTISNSIFKNSKGTAPEAGIDVEPNKNQLTQNIKILNTQCYGNAGSGIEVLGNNGIIQAVEVVNNTSNDNADNDVKIVNAIDLKLTNNNAKNIYVTQVYSKMSILQRITLWFKTVF